MWIIVLFALAISLHSTSGQDSSEKTKYSVGGVGYELIEQRLENLLEKITDGMEKVGKLGDKILNNQESLGEKIDAKISQQLRDQHFGVVKPPSCATTEQVAKIQVPVVDVYCEDKAFGGGWLVIQQRIDGSLNFTRPWLDYSFQFGKAGEKSEFWIGLEAMHYITSSGDYELAIELRTKSGSYKYARYSHFKVASEKDKYKITHLGYYSGTAGDSMHDSRNMPFTTYDSDNDAHPKGNCAQFHDGGWWFNSCGAASLNAPLGEKIYWYTWQRAADISRMMIRHKLSPSPSEAKRSEANDDSP